MPTSSITQAMQSLQAQWYNAVVSQGHLDSSSFQLVQGNLSLGTTSQALWNIFDTIPPLSLTNYWNPSQFNSFSSNYGAVISNIKQPASGAFQESMGDYYTAWEQYLHTSPPMPQGGMPQLFLNWAMENMPPDQAQSCYTDYLQVGDGAVTVAEQMWNAAQGTKAYNKSIDDVTSAITGAPSQSVSFNSLTSSSDASSTWAQGQVDVTLGFFEGGSADASYDQLTVALAQAGVNIQMTCAGLTTISAGPLAEGTITAGLTTYQPWYSSAALSLAYSNNNYEVWNTTPPTWQNTFGPNGNMLRVCSAIVVAEGVQATMTSNVGFSQADQQAFQAAANGGMWPFYSASGSTGWINTPHFDTQGNVTVTTNSPQGIPQILGVIVTPISKVFG